MTKEEQLKSNRLRPKANGKNKSKAIKNDKYLSWCHNQDLPCFSCGKRGVIELHHVKEASTDIKDDTKVIPLCGIECHRLGRMLSAHGTPKKFREVYPITEQERHAKEIYKRFKYEVNGYV